MADNFITTNALVLREVKYKEADRILTIFTSDKGKMTVKASNALRKNSKIGAGTQMLTYSEMVLYNNKGRYLVREANIKESFEGLKLDFSNYALGCYLSECVESMCQENVPDFEVLQMILNSLYALSNNMYDPKLIRAAFEMRFISMLGYTPDLSSCVICGNSNPVEPVLGTEIGHVCCRGCRNASVGNTSYLDDSSLAAMRHIIKASPKSFIPKGIEGESLEKLEKAVEVFFMRHTDKKFATLEYWKKL